MERNSRILEYNKIDLRKIIKTLWNEKILIFSITLIFMVAGYIYSTLKPKIYKTEIIIREVPGYFFEVYLPLLGSSILKQQLKNENFNNELQYNFNNDFKLSLSSFDTLFKFVENNDKISNFKNYLKENDISAKEYFRGKFKAVIDNRKNIQNNKYSLTFSQSLPGDVFLNDYVIFVHQQTIDEFKKQLIRGIINKINTTQQQLEIAKLINLENTIFQSTQPQALFYKGTKVLTQEIIYLNKLLNETKNLTLDYDPILEQASPPILISTSPIIYAIINSFLGFFFSLMLVFIKINFLK